MMKKLISAIFIVLLTGCAIVDTQKWEGNNEVLQGKGGAKTEIDGIDIWEYGSPAKKFKIIGVTSLLVGDGFAANSIIKNSLVSEVKKQNGDAAVSMNSTSSFAGTISNFSGYSTGNSFNGTGSSIALHSRKDVFYIVKYVTD